jgi:hypothetical protein
MVGRKQTSVERKATAKVSWSCAPQLQSMQLTQPVTLGRRFKKSDNIPVPGMTAEPVDQPEFLYHGK